MGNQRSGESRVPDGRSPLWRGHNLFRVITFLFALGVFFDQYDGYDRPRLGTVVIVVMAVWTVFTVWRYSLRSGRTNVLVLLDQLVVTLLVLTCQFVLSHEQMVVLKAPSVVTLWHATAVTAASVQWGMVGGALSGVLASAASWYIRGYIDVGMVRDFFLLVGLGVLIGLATETAQESARRLARAMRAEAATAERERLARSIHDSVLQVLARVRRRGSELGGEAAELAQLAGEQEIALRTLVTAAPHDEVEVGETDLATQLQVLRSGRVQVSVPATSVTLPTAWATDVLAVVKEALENVDRHAGPDARAWVLLEDLGQEVVVSVRDNGPGIPEGRLAAAEAEGRMGVAHSIRRRVENLGGTISLETAPGEGTEWEVRVSRPSSPNQAGSRQGGRR